MEAATTITGLLTMITSEHDNYEVRYLCVDIYVFQFDKVMTQERGWFFTQSAYIRWWEQMVTPVNQQQSHNNNYKDWAQRQSRAEEWERGDSGGCLAMSSLGIWVEQMRMNQSPLKTGSWIDEKNGETGWEGETEGRIGESVIVSTDKWWQNLGAGCHFGTIRTDVPGGVQRGKGNLPSRAAVFSNLIILGNKYCARN